MNVKGILFLGIVSFFTLFSFSENQVDTVCVFSSKMKMDVKSVIIKPENYNPLKHYPVVYLLHGFSDNYAQWVTAVPEIKTLSTQYQFIIVCPDGGYSSWYFDSPIDLKSQFESYITSDLVSYVDTHYSTLSDRNHRAISGLSMGGHGALYLAIRHKNLFANAGSMSGGVDLNASIGKFDIEKRLGEHNSNIELWDKNSVINMVDSLRNKDLHLLVDCGLNDFFYDINLSLHKKLISLKIDHDYIERPGEHNWEYWTNSIQYQLLFFYRCFDKSK
jgi:S-formylglutathione hydrolase FrmB